MTYQIETKSKEHLDKLLTCFFALGYDYGGRKTVKDVTDFFLYYKWLIVYSENKSLGGNVLPKPEYKTITFDEWLALKEAPKNIEVVLNSEYIAIVSSEEITVGCQKFTFDKFNELAEAVAKMKELTK